MNAVNSESIPDLRWVLRYSAIAFLFIVLWQSYGIFVAVPEFPPLFEGFGAALPPITNFVLAYYLPISAVITAISASSAGFLLFWPGAPAPQLKLAYIASLASFVGSFLWSGFIVYAMYAPILALSGPI